MPKFATEVNFKMAASTILKITVMAIISVAVTNICRKVFTGTEDDVVQSTLPSKFTSHKIQDGGDQWLENSRAYITHESVRLLCEYRVDVQPITDQLL